MRPASCSGTSIQRPAGDFNDQVFLARLASGDVPDLVRMSRPRVAQYASKGVLQPMDSCVKSVKKQYRVGAMNAMTYRGHVYGLPEFTNQITLIVNQSAFKDSGVPISAAQTKNKAALLATAKKLTKRNGSGDLTRIGFDPKIPEFFPLWVRWFGDDIISKDGLHAKLNTPHAKQALTYAVSIINAEGGWNKFKSFRDTFDFFGAQNPLVKDQLAFWPMESFIYNVFSNNSPNVDLVAKFFQNRKGGPITYFSGNAWVVPKGSKNKADALCVHEGRHVGERVARRGEDPRGGSQGVALDVHRALHGELGRGRQDLQRRVPVVRSSAVRQGRADPRARVEVRLRAPGQPRRAAVRGCLHERDQPRPRGLSSR